MKIIWKRSSISINYDVNFVRTSKSLCWTSTDTFKQNGIFPFHEIIMEAIRDKFPNTTVTHRKRGNIRLRFQSEADEAMFLLVADTMIIEIDSATI